MTDSLNNSPFFICTPLSKVVVQVRGWNHVTPVSVDKVGTYFRVAKVKQPETKFLDVGASSSNAAAMESQVIGA